MAKFVEKLPKTERPADWVLAPNAQRTGRDASAATAHGDFDDDQATLQATLARILGVSTGQAKFAHHRSAAAQRGQRQVIMGQSRTI